MDLPAIKRAMKGAHGHVVLVHFWATWCAPCLDELPTIEKAARELRPRGVDILSLSLDDPDRAVARVTKVLSEVAPSLTRSIARIGETDEFISAFDRHWEGAIPALFAYDADGQLRGRIIGEASRRDLEDLVGRASKVTAQPRPAH
jgi:thiol-disulfide isomerase/thioredoxin